MGYRGDTSYSTHVVDVCGLVVIGKQEIFGRLYVCLGGHISLERCYHDDLQKNAWHT